jgi:ATP/ADP translocase
MLNRMLYLRDGELSRLLPFFALYLLLFAAFALADGLALTLFVQKVGKEALAGAYGVVAVANLGALVVYAVFAERASSVRVFELILSANVVIFATAWGALAWSGDEPAWYYLLFACREIAFTLMLMHFGTFLQDYFTREEMSRTLPLVYSGGRVGGIVGGALLQHLTGPVGLVNLLGVFVVLVVAGMALLVAVAWRCPLASRADDHLGDAGVVPPAARAGRDPEAEARASYLGFLRYVWLSPLLFWTSLVTLCFVVCRWLLNFRYSSFFREHFATENAMAEFLGEYTQWALLLSLVVQVFVVNRLIARLGLRGAHLVYALLLLACLLLCMGPMTLPLAIFARLVETELRFGLRNPINQLLTNKFAKSLRVRVRAWTLGLLIPLGTMLCSGLLLGLEHWGLLSWVPVLGGLLGAVYLLASLGLTWSFSESASQFILPQASSER